MKARLKKLFLISVISFLISLPLLALAQEAPENAPSQNISQDAMGNLQNPLGSEVLTPQQLYGRIIYAFMGITGTLALLMFLVGGFQWMTAAGNPERVKKGRDTLMWAVLGLIVIFSSYAILRAVLETLQF